MLNTYYTVSEHVDHQNSVEIRSAKTKRLVATVYAPTTDSKTSATEEAKLLAAAPMYLAALRKIMQASRAEVCGKILEPRDGITTGAPLLAAIQNAKDVLDAHAPVWPAAAVRK